MTTPLFPNLRAAMTQGAMPGHEPRFDTVKAELLSTMSAPLTGVAEEMLLAILAFDGELQLDESSEMPHRMSPEDMLKSLAAQALVVRTGAKHTDAIRRVEVAAEPALACTLRAVMNRMGLVGGVSA